MPSAPSRKSPPLKIYVDTNVIVRWPEIFAFRKRGVELVLPQAVVDEVGAVSSTMANSLRLLIDRAATSEFVSIEPSPPGSNSGAVSSGDNYRPIKGAELAILVQAVASKHPRKALASDDRDVIHAAAAAGLETISGKELVSLLREGNDLEKDIQKSATAYKLSSWLIAIIVGLTLSQIGYLLSFSGPAIQWAFYNIGIVGIFAAAVIGLGLFALRNRKPLFYGTVEVVVGMASVNAGLRSVRDLSLTGAVNFGAILAVFAGVYVVVRGLDNMERGSGGTWLERPFSRLIGKSR